MLNHVDIGISKNTKPPDFSGGLACSGDRNFIRLTTLERIVEVKIGPHWRIPSIDVPRAGYCPTPEL
jgi:hypothetical protein